MTKSEIVRQYAEDNGIPFIDLSLSMPVKGDMIGEPFADEVILAMVNQLHEDRQIGEYPLPIWMSAPGLGKSYHVGPVDLSPVYMDYSGSMSDGSLRKFYEETKTLMNSLKDCDRYKTIIFNDGFDRFDDHFFDPHAPIIGERKVNPQLKATNRRRNKAARAARRRTR